MVGPRVTAKPRLAWERPRPQNRVRRGIDGAHRAAHVHREDPAGVIAESAGAAVGSSTARPDERTVHQATVRQVRPTVDDQRMGGRAHPGAPPTGEWRDGGVVELRTSTE